MKKSNIWGFATMALASLALSSCSKFLDENPDGYYVQGNTPYKISRFLTYAYPLASQAYIGELSSDNTYEDGDYNQNKDLFLDQAAHWQQITYTSGAGSYDGPAKQWEQYYYAIGQVNEALNLIEESGDHGARNEASRGEALVVRAWSHFQLANLFCLPYNFDGRGGETNLGIPYVAERITTLTPDYARGTLKETYEKIEKDLLDGIAILERNVVTYQSEAIRKFHFTAESAYAFAVRFYLYYGKMDKVKEYADRILGTDARSRLRDWRGNFESLNRENANAAALAYYNPNNPANLLVTSLYSYYQDLSSSGESYSYTRYTHQNETARRETLYRNIWNEGSVGNNSYAFAAQEFRTPRLDKVYQAKLPVLNSYQTVEVQLTTDEVLLSRAEAEIRMGDLAAGLADLNTWSDNYLRSTVTKRTFTQQEIVDYYNGLPYASRDVISPKKHLTGAHFTISSGAIQEGTPTEALLQYVLQCRRVLTLNEGLRWADIKRYGIPVYRWKNINPNINTYRVPEGDDYELKSNDLRQAISLPEYAAVGQTQQNPR